MRHALLFRENEEPVLVSAENVKNGLYRRDEEFVDLEYEFKVVFVRGARNNGRPYFRLYYSYEEYKKLYPERASRYEIIANMKHFKESEWHKHWKKLVSEFCTIERCVKNPETNKWKFADAFYEKTQTCIEFQHSYIAFDFEERNAFYKNLSINTVWLYDLPNANARQSETGSIEILEDNARGFFRISENPENLKQHRVYIQVKSGEIYRVRKLQRYESSVEEKSTIRYFFSTEIYTQDEFVDAIKENRLGDVGEQTTNAPKSDVPQTLQALWKGDYRWMIVKNVENEDVICINRNHQNEMFREYSTGCIMYVYMDDKYPSTSSKSKREYRLSHQKEKAPIWLLVEAKKVTE